MHIWLLIVLLSSRGAQQATAPRPLSMNERCEGSKNRRNNEGKTEAKCIWVLIKYCINLKLILVKNWMKFSTADTPQLQTSHRSGHLFHYLFFKKEENLKIKMAVTWPDMLHASSWKNVFFPPWSETCQITSPPSAPQWRLLLAGIHHMKMHNAAEPHAPFSHWSLLFCHREETSAERCSNYCR